MHMMKHEVSEEEKQKVGIWAHRGCSYRFPENTLPAFEEAAKLPGLTGIEMDVQYSSDHQMVVFHDETLDRVTGVEGYVKDHTLKELQAMKFKKSEQFDRIYIPTLREFLEDMKPYCEKGMLINIELKTSEIRYEGIEQDAYNLVKELGMCDSIVWSSFLADSIRTPRPACWIRRFPAAKSRGIPFTAMPTIRPAQEWKGLQKRKSKTLRRITRLSGLGTPMNPSISWTAPCGVWISGTTPITGLRTSSRICRRGT